MSCLTPRVPSRLMQRRRWLQSAAALSLPALGAFTQAQPAAFPSRPIKLLIAFPAGGPTDITMRQLGRRGFIRVDARRLDRDGMQGGFCSKYRDICKKTNAADRPSQVIARHDE